MVDEKKIQQLGLTLGQVTQAIRSFNNNIPLGNHTLGDFRYDYRIKGKVETLSELMDVPISIGNTNQGPRKYVKLADIASVQRNYKDDSASYGGIAQDGDNVATTVIIYKANRSNIFENA